MTVSTHSRLKAAGSAMSESGDLFPCFNTQPPEGGWDFGLVEGKDHGVFQHTAA